MNALAAKIAERAQRIVHLDEYGWWFRIHRITSADIFGTGGAFLLAAEAAVKAASGDASEGKEETEAARIERIGAALMRDPEQIAQGAQAQAHIVCAGVRACSEDGVAFQPLRIVAQGQSEPGAGVLHVADIPDAVVAQLALEILDLSRGGAARKGGAHFPGGATGTPVHSGQPRGD